MVYYFLILSYFSFASTCCGGGSGTSFVITSDYEHVAQVNFSHSVITHKSDSNGEIISASGLRTKEILLLSFAVRRELWQFAFQGGVISKNLRDYESSTGLLNPNFSISYEFLPEYFYSIWPRGFFSLSYTPALGKSLKNAQKKYLTDALNNSKDDLYLSLLLIKRLYDFAINFDLKVNNLGDIGEGLGLVYSFNELSFSSSLKYFQKKYTVSFSAGLSVSDYLIKVFYSDETFFTRSRNEGLEKTLGLSVRSFF